jgi:hypothetical protein
MSDVVDELLELLDAGARAGTQRPLSVLLAACERHGADPNVVLRAVWRSLRVRTDVQRNHCDQLEAFCKAPQVRRVRRVRHA